MDEYVNTSLRSADEVRSITDRINSTYKRIEELDIPSLIYQAQNRGEYFTDVEIRFNDDFIGIKAILERLGYKVYRFGDGGKKSKIRIRWGIGPDEKDDDDEDDAEETVLPEHKIINAWATGLCFPKEMVDNLGVDCTDAVATIVQNVLRHRDRVELKEFQEQIVNLVSRVEALEKLREF